MKNKEQTVHKWIFSEIKKRDGITQAEIAKKVGITASSLTNRLDGACSFNNVWDMLRACGYSMVLQKMPEGKEPTISFTVSACVDCQYKKAIDSMFLAFDEISAERAVNTVHSTIEEE